MLATTTPAVDFLIRRNDLAQHQFAVADDADSMELGPNQLLIQVEKFALSANNITYALAGESFHYWDFFPAPPGWGRVPVWGFGTVVRTHHNEIHEGERIFGFLPVSSYVTMEAGRVTPMAFTDCSPHRSSLPGVYNNYRRTAGDPLYDATREDYQMLFWPLFYTSFALHDFLTEHHFFDADAIVVTSASSKTALGLAFLLSSSPSPRPQLIGLTSPSSVAFVEGTRCCDAVFSYDAIRSLGRDRKTVLVDFSGNAAVLSELHHHLGNHLQHSCRAGFTHWDRTDDNASLPGPAAAVFFAPLQIQKRLAEWGPAELQRRFGESWGKMLGVADRWITIQQRQGTDDVAGAYQSILTGSTPGNIGIVLSL